MMKLSRKIKNEVQCLLCPSYCLLSKGQRGKCLARISNGEEIILDSYGEITSMAVELIEKKPITHFLEKGSKVLSLGSYGCSFLGKCLWCENHKISQFKLKNFKKYSLKEIIHFAKEYTCWGICMTYNEPTISYEFLMDLAEEAHNNSLFFFLKTNGYVNKEPWKEICGITNAMNIDLKGSNEKYSKVLGAEGGIVKSRIKEAYNYGAHIEISIPLHYDDIKYEINDIGSYLKSIDNNIPCHLLKIYSSYKYSKTTTDIDIKKAENILKKYMSNISIH